MIPQQKHAIILGIPDMNVDSIKAPVTAIAIVNINEFISFPLLVLVVY